MIVTQPGLDPGARVGRYTVVGTLGRGAMGGVWAVVDEAGRRFALKSPLSGLDASAQATKRFKREATALHMIDHPNLISAVDVFVENGHLFLVMEHVEGPTLTKELERAPFVPRRALVVVRQILDGLSHAHTRGLVHRDLKPDNIMLVQWMQDGQVWEKVRILDFGIVKLVGHVEEVMGGKLTKTGLVFGTPAYMAPEHALGRVVDLRADLYAVGIILIELLTRRQPYSHPDIAMVLQMQVKAPVPNLRELSFDAPWCTPELCAVVDGALAKDPNQRFATAQLMANALDEAYRSFDRVGC